MASPQFEALREKLLRAGIAPRHVRRYLKELRQHYDDLIAEEIAGGATGEEARLAARTRLGSDDELAAAMLGEPSLRSVSARYPWAVFGLGPVLLLPLLVFLGVLAQVGIIKLHGYVTGIPDGGGFPAPDWIRSTFAIWDWSMMYVFPVAVAALFCLVAIRQRLRTIWVTPGVLTILAFGATLTVGMVYSDLPGQSEFNVSVGGGSEMAPRVYANLLIGVALVVLQWWSMRRKTDTSSA